MYNYFWYQNKSFTKSLPNTSNKKLKYSIKEKLIKSRKNKFYNIHILLFDLNFLIYLYEKIISFPRFFFNLKQIKFRNFLNLANSIKKKFYKFSNKTLIPKFKINIHLNNIQNLVIQFGIKKILQYVHYTLFKKISQKCLIIQKVKFLLMHYTLIASITFLKLDKFKSIHIFINFIKKYICDYKFIILLLEILKCKNTFDFSDKNTFFIKSTHLLYKVINNIYFIKFNLYLIIFLKEYNITIPLIKKKLKFEIFIFKAFKSTLFLRVKINFLKFNLCKIFLKSKILLLYSFFQIAYTRFVNSFLLGFNGPKTIILFIKNKFELFLKSNLNLNFFLKKFYYKKIFFGGLLFFKTKQFYYFSLKNLTSIFRNVNTRIIQNIKIFISFDKLEILFQKYQILNKKQKPTAVKYLIFLFSESIIIWFNFLLLGLLKYYKHINNYKKLKIFIIYLFKWSIIYTLSKKHKKELKTIFKKYSYTIILKNINKNIIARFINLLQAHYLHNKKRYFFLLKEYIYKNLENVI
jgi:hypothetical protein